MPEVLTCPMCKGHNIRPDMIGCHCIDCGWDGSWDRARPKTADKETSIRDWFAGMALVGLIASGKGAMMESTAMDAYKFADSMLKERQKQGRME